MNINREITFFLIVFVLFAYTSCYIVNDQERDSIFKPMPAKQTNIDFSNEIIYDREFNIITFPYLYNGGGVAAGDINNDGLIDLYFTGNMVSSRLYLNKGNFEFEDITELSATLTKGWAGGVSMVDINHDGYLDIYVCITGSEDSTPKERQNLLFINNQDSTFTESATDYGLADPGFTTHAAFFDYDRDGDLDVFLINNFVGTFSRENRISLRSEVNNSTSKSTDILYRNNGNGTFTDISQEAGIVKEGYSLGVAVSDINRDGWPDIFVSNDIQTDNLLYINNGDGIFYDKSDRFFKHTSYAGMGTDIADFNNDGWPDILQVDMLPSSLEKKQQVTGSLSYGYLQKLNQKGYQRQYTQNTLQISNGINIRGNVIFSDIGQLAGIESTGWSWSSLFGDYDNDGMKDIMITNGYPKAINNYDYVLKVSRSGMFGDDSSKKQRTYIIMDQLKGYKLSNYFFRNNGDLTFSDVSNKWGVNNTSFSYGATQADLDNDGDLDIAINNLNDKGAILQNQADYLTNNHYLTIRLKGDSINTEGIGSKVVLTVNGKEQYKYVNPYRGYQSTMDSRVHFGLGNYEKVDSLQVTWPNEHCQLIKNVKADQFLTVNYKNATPCSPNKKFRKSLVTKTNKLGINYTHKENKFVDFDRQPLLPRMLSRLGPAVTIGDVNNDDREDIFLGGATGFAGKLYIQQKDGTFAESDQMQAWENDKAFEDTDAIFFDANGDGYADLYVVSGGNSFSPASAKLQDRLYLNTGAGRFVKTYNILPRMYTSGSTVKPADYDQDGDVDLFVAGRLIPGQYPKAARSYILRNDGNSFTDVTADIAPDLVEPGLLTDAVWVDFNEDGTLDLVTTGIWMPVTFYENNHGYFHNITSSTGLNQQVGWWQSIEKADFDNDGDMDFAVGNIGLNQGYSTSGIPLYVIAQDFNDNQQLDAILATKKEGAFYPLHGMRNMVRQIPLLGRKLRSFKMYAGMSLRQLMHKDLDDNTLQYQANNLKSSIIINNEDSFSMYPLPNAAQISSINDVQILDINNDHNIDLLVAGNIYNPNPEFTRSDASNGLVLLNDGRGKFTPISPYKSGVLTPENVRKLALLTTQKGEYILVVNNNNSLQVMDMQY